MKNGLLVYAAPTGIVNIGDYIQSLAARQFIGNNINYYINRERLDEFNEDEVRLIMNGWYTHEPNHWPPSRSIIPLFVALHISSLVKDQLLDNKGVQYFKQHEPIGCRDNETVRILKEKGIEAYFSGCLTLTLGNTFSTEINDGNIYFVDAFVSFKKNIRSFLKLFYFGFTKFKLVKKLAKKQFNSLSFHYFIKSALFYSQYSILFSDDLLLQANYINHEMPVDIFANEKAKFECAKELLKKYAQAKLVITSRIHCALPCLAIETPILYVENVEQDEWSYCRLDGLRDLFTIITSKNGKLSFNFDGKINSDSIFKNKDTYKFLRDELNEKCTSFVNE